MVSGTGSEMNEESSIKAGWQRSIQSEPRSTLDRRPYRMVRFICEI